MAALSDLSQIIFSVPDIALEDELDEEQEKDVLGVLEGLTIAEKMRLVREIKSSVFDSWDAPRGTKLIPIPNCQDGRELVYVPGIAGSGKTTFVVAYVHGYKWLYPERKVYMIGEKFDRELGRIGVIELPLEELRPVEEEEQAPNPFETEATPGAASGGGARRRPKKKLTFVDHKQFSKSLLIFDDVDAIGDPELKKGVHMLARQVVHVGRSDQICCCFTSHEHLGGHFTKEIVKSANRIAFFPKRNQAEITSFFETYLKPFRRSVLPLVLGMPSQRDTWWVCFTRHAPMHLLSERQLLAVK